MANPSLSACLAEIKENPGEFYVYRMSRPNGDPFYIGAGRKRRITCHETPKAVAARSRKNSIIRKIRNAGDFVLYSIDSWFENWDGAAERERNLISEIGRADLGTGPLANATSGGDGVNDLSPEGRAKHKAATKRARQEPELRARHSLIIKEKWQDADYRDRQVANLKSRWAVDGVRATQSSKMREKFTNQEFRLTHSAATAAAIGTPEQRERQSKASKKMWSDPEMKRKWIATRRALLEDPATRQKHSSASKKMWEDPEYRNKVLRSRKLSEKCDGKAGLAAARIWHQNNPDLSRSYTEKSLAAAYEWRRLNPQAHRETIASATAASARWRIDNPERYAEIQAKATAAGTEARRMKAETRKRCVALMEDASLQTFLPPRPRAPWREWTAFEALLLASVR